MRLREFLNTCITEASGPKSPEDYEELARKHTTDGQRGGPGKDYALKMADRARMAAKILKDGGSQEAAWRHYQGTDVAEGVGDSEEGWCLVMANGQVTGNIYKDMSDAIAQQKRAPVATEIKWGKRASDGEYLQTRAVNPSEEVKQSSQALQFHVVSKLDGRVLASYATRQEAEKNAHGNPVLAGDLETVGDQKFVRESQQSDYRVTNSWTDRGLTHKRWDLDHAQGEAADRHQSSIALWQERGQDPKYIASHRIERGYWTNQSARQSPTTVTHKSQHTSLADAKAALKAHTDELYGIKEGFGDPLTGYHIVYRNSGNIVHGTPSFERQDDAQKYLMQKMFSNHHLYKVVHTSKIGVVEAKRDSYGLRQFTVAQVEAKIKDGEWEATQDVKPGHVEIMKGARRERETISVTEAAHSNIHMVAKADSLIVLCDGGQFSFRSGGRRHARMTHGDWDHIAAAVKNRTTVTVGGVTVEPKADSWQLKDSTGTVFAILDAGEMDKLLADVDTYLDKLGQ